MTRKCSYPQCTHRRPIRDKVAPSCKMHVFPANRQVCQDWLDACHFKVSPTNIPAALFICSCHFAAGQGPTADNPKPLPYVPSNEAQEAILQKRFQPNTNTRAALVDPFEAFFDENNPDNPAPLQSRVSDLVNSPNNRPSPVPLLCPPSEPKKFCDSAQSSSTNSLGHSTFQQKNVNATSRIGVEREVENSRQILLAIPLRLTQAVEEASPDKLNQVSLKEVPRKHKLADSREKEKEEKPAMRDVGTDTQCTFAIFSYENSIRHRREKHFEDITGVSRTTFEALYKFLGGDEVCSQLNYKYDDNNPVEEVDVSHSSKGHLFITLVRLRRGYSLRDLRLFFNLETSQLSAIFFTWVKFLATKFQSLEQCMFVNVASQQEDKPDCYKQFPNLRCIIGTTDIKIQNSTDTDQEDSLDFNEEYYDCVKFLFAISVFGGLSFISEGIEGNVSDRKLFMKSGILEYLLPGEAIMSDRSYDVESYLEDSDVQLLTPPALGKRKAFTEKERKILATSQNQIHTFLIAMKRFKFITNVVPITVHSILPDIVRVCACLLNFREPYRKWHVPDSSITF